MHPRALIIALTMLSCLTWSAWTQGSDYAQLDKNIEKLVTEQNVPSLAYAILKPGEAPHIRTLGKINLESNQQTTADTPYRIASISKIIVGIAVMQLVESGQLSLNTPVAELLPELAFNNPWASTHPVRLVHLVENTTGWNDISLAEFAYPNHPPLDLRASLALNPSSRTSRWPPGTRHAYTNSTAAVAAWIVESVTGMSFSSYTEQHIFAPLGIASATYDQVKGTQGYKKGRATPYKALLMRPAGALYLSLEDMVKLSQMMLNKGTPLLSADTMARVQRSESTNVGVFEAGYGIFNYARHYQGWLFRGHDGALPGWMSELSYSPEHQVGFIVLQNSEQPRAFRQVVTLISDYLIKEFPSPSTDAQSITEDMQNLSGYYRYLNTRVEKRYFLERLVASFKLDINSQQAVFSSVFPPGWKRPLVPTGQNSWQNEQGQLVMKAGTDPLAADVLHYGDRVYTPISAFSAWADKVVLITWLLLLLIITPFSLVWLIKWRRGKYDARHQRLPRQIMTVAVWSALLFLLFLAMGMASPITRLGQIGVFSLGLLISSLLLPCVTAWACWLQFTLRNAGVHKFLYVSGTLFLLLQLLVVGYLGWFDVIGIRSWS